MDIIEMNESPALNYHIVTMLQRNDSSPIST